MSTVTEDDVHTALEYLISIEQNCTVGVETADEYHAAIAPHLPEIERARQTLKSFGEAISPRTLPKMQDTYYGFTNSARYLRSNIVLSVVRSELTKAWNGIGPWRI